MLLFYNNSHVSFYKQKCKSKPYFVDAQDNLFRAALREHTHVFCLARTKAYFRYGCCDAVKEMMSINIWIKHGFSCINTRQVPREVLKTEAGGRSF